MLQQADNNSDQSTCCFLLPSSDNDKFLPSVVMKESFSLKRYVQQWGREMNTHTLDDVMEVIC